MENEEFTEDTDFSSLVLPDNSYVQEAVDQYEKRIYDLQQLLEISRSLCSTLEYSTLIESILFTCMSQMHVTGAGIFVYDDIDSNSFNLSSNHTGIDLDPSINYSISADSPVIQILGKSARTYSIPSIKNDLAPGADIKEVESLHPTLIVPLFHKNRMNGFLVLGERLDIGEGADYTEYDKEQILSIASLAAVAINNAALLEKSSTDMMTHLKLKYFFYNVLTDFKDGWQYNDIDGSITGTKGDILYKIYYVDDCVNLYKNANEGRTLWNPTDVTTKITHSYFIEDGSFLRCSDITLGYTLPKNLIKKVGLTKARFYVSASNLFIITGYTGYDPEVDIQTGLTCGMDYNRYPRARSFIFGTNITF